MMRCSENLKLTGNPPGNPDLPFLYVALPVMDEPELLPRLLACFASQTYRRFKIVACVNQPDSWWNDPEKSDACENNAICLRLLENFREIDTTVIDHTSRGRGWTGKRYGVGWARKTVMDEIGKEASPGDIIVSLDADTVISDDYLLSIAVNFRRHPEAVALSAPYFHNLVNDVRANRAMLRYEIYMRHYFLNLARIGSPYAFTALGSAMALPVWAYRAIGGMIPKLSGEDFYFLQKLRKFGPVLLWNDEMVYPEARFSDRVFFGTGPAMIKGAEGDWKSYPVYPMVLFNKIAETYQMLPELYLKTSPTAITSFMASVSGEKDPWQPLRLNHKDFGHFARAFHEKFDGLRLLQFLKMSNEQSQSADEENLRNYVSNVFSKPELEKTGIEWKQLSFAESPVEELINVRAFLFEKEMNVRATTIPV
jgi:hypothetical protein